MVKGKFVLAAATVATASLSVFAGASQASVVVASYTEPGDAGQTLAGAANAGSNPGTINGTLSSDNDADLYQFSVTTAGTYTFTTNNTVTNTAGTDTELSLFTSNGTPILLNDDASGTTLASTFSTSLTAGTLYYVGVAVSGDEPVNSANQDLFALPAEPGNGDTTAVRGPASGVNPATLATFSGNAETGGAGVYQIGITPAAVPEPTTWAIIGVTAATGAFLRRRRAA